MLKASSPARQAEGSTLWLGLSHENLKRLRAGQPIGIPPEEIAALTADSGAISGLVIFAGPTEADLKGWLVKNGMIGPDTREEFPGIDDPKGEK